MMKPEDKRDLKKSYKRLALFLAIVFVFDAFIAFLFFKYTKINEILCGFIMVVITGILYLLFTLICAKIDYNKKKKIEESGKKDPFTKN